MVGKAYRVPSAGDRLHKQQKQIKELQAINRLRNTPRPVASTAFSGVSAAGSQGGTGNFLRPAGDTMIGPFALAPPVNFRIQIDSDGAIDIGKSSSNSQYTSNIQLDSIQPNTFVLDTIKGAAFDGQIIIIRTFAPPIPFTIAQATLANGGNIQTLNDVDFAVGDLRTMTFIFDESLIIFANTGGTWREISGDNTGGSGVSFPIDFPEDDRETVGASIQEILFTDSDRHSVKMVISGDVELVFSSPPTNETAYTNIIIVQNVTGGHTLTLPIGTINKEIVEAGFLTGANEETGIVIKFAFGVFYAFLETGNIVSGGFAFSGNLSDLVIDTTKNWLAQGITNFGNLTGVTGIDMDGGTATLQGVKLIDFIQVGQSIDSVSAGLDYFVDQFQRHEFKTTNGSFLAMDEVNASDRRLDIKQNRETNIGKLMFSPTFDNDTVATAEIYETLTLGNLRYVSNNAHIFVQEGIPTLMSVGNFAGEGGLVQDIALLNFNSLTGEFLANNGDFQLDGIDMKVLSGGVVRNFSDIGKPSPLTTQGDLFGFDTVDARIPVGTDGQVLTANSAVSLGVEWATGGGGGQSNEIVSGDSSLAVIDGIGFSWVLDGFTIATMTTNFLLGLNLDMDSSNILNPNKIVLANGLEIVNADTENTEIVIPTTDFFKIIEGIDIRIQVDKNVIINADSGDDIRFLEQGVEVGRYDGGNNNWVFNPENDVQLSPIIDLDLTPQNDIIMNPAGDIKVFDDLDMQAGTTIDFPSAASVPVGTASDGIQVKIGGVLKVIKAYNP